MTRDLTSVELFAGAGGLGLGLARAGFRPRAVAEWNRHACDSIRRNTDWPVFEGDVRALDYSSISGPIDLVAGGPPCQPFSMGGRHRASGDRRDMFPAMADAVRFLAPRAFLVENVKGLTRPAFGEYFSYILARLETPEVARRPGEAWTDHSRRLRQGRGDREGLRYGVSFRVVNAADYGVPQIRERVFIVGFRADLGVPWSFPKPTHSLDALLADQYETGDYWRRHGVKPGGTARLVPRREPRVPDSAPWRTVRDALTGLPDPERDPDAARRFADHGFQPGVRFYPGHTGSTPDRPAKTLKAGDHGVPGGENALVRDDGTGRYFTVRESARLQTFPDSYVFGAAWSVAMRQLGNAVPVDLAHAMAAGAAAALRDAERIVTPAKEIAAAAE